MTDTRSVKPLTPGQERWKVIKKTLQRDKFLMLLWLPLLAFYIVFHYAPIPGIIIAFREFKPGRGIYGSGWVGLENIMMFVNSFYCWRLIRNTVILSIYSLVFGFPVPIIFAVVVCEIRQGGLRRVVQTVSYLPHFISTVVLVGMLKQFFCLDTGIVNRIIEMFGGTQVNFFMDPKCFRPLYVGSGIWQSFGFSSIIYISAILGVDPSLYESAKIDGSSKFKDFWYITLPSILPTIIILFIMQLGKVMSVGFEKVYLMYSPSVYDTADVIATYNYRKGIVDSDYSYSSAVGLFNSLINFALVYGSNVLCRKLTNSSLW